MSAPIAGEPVPCTFRGCRSSPVQRITNATGRSWYGCALHAPAMATAMGCGQPIEASVYVEPWPLPARRRRP